MWQPSPEQETRIRRVAGSLLATVETVWCIDGEGRMPGCGFCSGGPAVHFDNLGQEPLATRFAGTLARLEEQFSADELQLVLPEVLAYPLVWNAPLARNAGATSGVVAQVAGTITAGFVLDHPSDAAVELLGKRLQHVLAHPYDGAEPEANRGLLSLPPSRYLFPGLDDCIDLLCRLSRHPGAIAWLEDLVNGRLDAGPIELPPAFDKPPSMAYAIHEWALLSILPQVIDRLQGLGLFDETSLEQAARHLPGIVSLPARAARWASLQAVSTPAPASLSSPEAKGMFASHAWKLACELNEETARIFLETPRPRGIRFFLKACEHIERRSVKQLVKVAWAALGKGTIEEALAHMADIEALDANDRGETIATQLGTFQASTLRTVLPVAGAAATLVLHALGWDDAVPLLLFIRRLARLNEQGSPFAGTHDMPNSSDAAEGVLDRAEVAALLARAGEARAQTIFRALERAGLPVKKTVLVIEAVLGTNREAVLEALPRRGQAAVKAYGLLPLQSQDELLERYLTLKEFALGSKARGSERQANERAAVEVAFAHLAQTAGYEDARRLEWDMEIRISAGSAPLRESFDVGEYRVQVSADEEPGISVHKGRRALKSIPKAVRESAAYREAKSARESLREQGRRFRDAIEEHLQSGKPLGPEDLDTWRKIPAALSLLRRVVLIGEQGRLGLLDATRQSLQGLDGQSEEIRGAVTVAHPIRTYWAGALAAWQHRVCALGLVQPVRQVFREIYLPDAADGPNATCTRRFAGVTVNARQAARLLQSRGWRSETGDYSVPYKAFPEMRLQAVFDFPDSGHYLTETKTLTSGELYFLEYPLERMSSRRTLDGRGHVLFSQVQAQVFSEALRDADLAVSVARLEEGAPLSKEVLQKRGELVVALAAVLELRGVEAAGHFVRVRGALSSYRIHLGTRCAYLEAGGQLPSLPAPPARVAAAVAPLAGEEDTWLGDVMSAVSVLAHDDETFDAELRRRLRAGA